MGKRGGGERGLWKGVQWRGFGVWDRVAGEEVGGRLETRW